MTHDPIPDLSEPPNNVPLPFVDKQRWSNLLLRRWPKCPPHLRYQQWYQWTSLRAAPTLENLPNITRVLLSLPDAVVIEEMGWSNIELINPAKRKARIDMMAQGIESPPLVLEDVIEWAFSMRRKLARAETMARSMAQEAEDLERFKTLSPAEQAEMIKEKIADAEHRAKKTREYRSRYRTMKQLLSPMNRTGIVPRLLPNGRIDYTSLPMHGIQEDMPWSRRHVRDLPLLHDEMSNQ
jgi:hypothetical protein